MTDFSRRDFLRASALAAAGVALNPDFTPGLDAAGGPATGWDAVPGILQRIRPPVFPARDFPITQFGAVPDGAADCSQAFAQAIAACAKAGGGRVVVPEGRFLTGPIHLRSNVNLHVTKGATVLFSTDPQKYTPLVFTRWEGVELMGLSPLIYAFEQENVAVTGEGVLDGQADETNWWPMKGTPASGARQGQRTQVSARTKLMQLAEQGVTFAEDTLRQAQETEDLLAGFDRPGRSPRRAPSARASPRQSRPRFVRCWVEPVTRRARATPNRLRSGSATPERLVWLRLPVNWVQSAWHALYNSSKRVEAITPVNGKAGSVARLWKHWLKKSSRSGTENRTAWINTPVHSGF